MNEWYDYVNIFASIATVITTFIKCKKWMLSRMRKYNIRTSDIVTIVFVFILGGIIATVLYFNVFGPIIQIITTPLSNEVYVILKHMVVPLSVYIIIFSLSLKYIHLGERFKEFSILGVICSGVMLFAVINCIYRDNITNIVNFSPLKSILSCLTMHVFLFILTIFNKD